MLAPHEIYEPKNVGAAPSCRCLLTLYTSGVPESPLKTLKERKHSENSVFRLLLRH